MAFSKIKADATELDLATQAEIDLKSPLASPTFTGTVAGVTATHVGLSNVDNTTDALKPVSTATSTALALKSTIASPVFTTSIKVTGGSAPGSPSAGMIYYDSTSNGLKVYNGTSWNTLTNRAIGGVITGYAGYIVHTFTTSGVFIPSGVEAVDYLVVAGGGSGGVWHAGGGGAGGVRTGTSFSTTAVSYTITVGAGGAGGASAVGAKGDDSVFGDITAEGGGRGGNYHTTTPGAGGSGAGGNGTTTPHLTFLEGADGENDGVSTFGTSTYQGHVGGDGGYNHAGGGGGGAGAGGETATSATAAGDGGVGISTFWGMDNTNTKLLLDNADIGEVSGSSRYVAGGGGAGTYSGTSAGNAGAGGLGGGGRGSYNGNTSPPLAALDNMGAGGAGAGSQGGTTAYSVQTTGGTGVVIIRYPI
jgi:hypothetical protein